MTSGSPPQRFVIRRYWWTQPLLLVIGLVRDANSYAAIEGDRLRVRFGWFFDNSFPLADIEYVERARWPWYMGLGWRTNFVGRVGAIGSYDGIVEIGFRRRQRAGWILPLVKLPCRRLSVSLQEPDAFVAALRGAMPAGQA